MMRLVWLVMRDFRLVCIYCLDLVFRVEVVLLRMRIGVFLSRVLVIEMCCFWLLESLILCFLMRVLYCWENCLMKWLV